MNPDRFDSEVKESLPRRAVQVTEVTLADVFLMGQWVVGHLDQSELANVG
jgi:hypothetical protein